MRFLSAIASLLLLRSSVGQMCPEIPSTTEEITPTLIFSYSIILATSTDERSILCARLESDSEGFIGLAVAPSDSMIGGEAIIGLPDDGTVLKYYLGGKSSSAVELRPEEMQTLMDVSILQDNGTTTMAFTKFLQEDGEIEILTNGDNLFLYAQASSNELGYHGSDRGNFVIDFKMDSATPSPTPAETSGATPTATFGATPVVSNTASYMGKTPSPTEVFEGTKPPAPKPAPKPDMAPEVGETAPSNIASTARGIASLILSVSAVVAYFGI